MNLPGIPPAPTAKTITAALDAFHPPHQWAFFPELRMAAGFGNPRAEQRMDAWAICRWRDAQRADHLRRAFEIKVSAADLTKELRNPDKRWFAYSFSNEFYFVAPRGLVNPKHLDPLDGLMEFDAGAITITKPARIRTAMFPRWDFVAALASRVCKEEKRK